MRIQVTLSDQARQLAEIERTGVLLARSVLQAQPDGEKDVAEVLRRFREQNEAVLKQLQNLATEQPAVNGAKDVPDFHRMEGDGASTPALAMQLRRPKADIRDEPRAGDQLAYVEQCIDQLECALAETSLDLDRSERMIERGDPEENYVSYLHFVTGIVNSAASIPSIEVSVRDGVLLLC